MRYVRSVFLAVALTGLLPGCDDEVLPLPFPADAATDRGASDGSRSESGSSEAATVSDAGTEASATPDDAGTEASATDASVSNDDDASDDAEAGD
jgi:hypothetical protein